MAVMGDLRPHHGPCSTPADVDQLMQVGKTKVGLRKALRAEILFQKLVLKKKSPLLKVTGSALTPVNRLMEFFGGHILQRLPPLQPQDARANKRPRTVPFGQDSESGTELQDEEADAASDSGGKSRV